MIGLVSVVATIYGYRLIHAYTRILSIVSGIALVAGFILVITWSSGDGGASVATGTFNWGGFMATVSVGALWQIAYAPYVSDYSRYMPADTGPKRAFWASYWGCVLGASFPMIFGALVGSKLVEAGMNSDNVVEGWVCCCNP
ncbi:cytosine permease [Leucobacter insecticola]|uniref:cytosine permease n=1 Tax=Leucobacter insecticola TaxID=2714934 RepID=UPI00244DC9CB|nr:cytosine permease [Leucobacter insecticola]